MINYYLPAMMRKRELLNLQHLPILVLLDGHSSRLSVSVLNFCRKNTIHILILPAHTSSITQPLDCAPNGVLKNVFCKESALRVNYARGPSLPNQSTDSPPAAILENEGTDTWISTHHLEEDDTIPPLPEFLLASHTSQSYRDSAPAHRKLLAEVLPLALDSALSQKVIAAGWRKSGLLPFNPDSVINNLPEGTSIQLPQRGRISISSKLLTDDEMFSSLCQWRKSQLEMLLSTKNNSPAIIDELKRELNDITVNCQQLHHHIITPSCTIPHYPFNTPFQTIPSDSPGETSLLSTRTEHNKQEFHSGSDDYMLENPISVFDSVSGTQLSGKRKRRVEQMQNVENESMVTTSQRCKRKASEAAMTVIGSLLDSDSESDSYDGEDLYCSEMM